MAAKRAEAEVGGRLAEQPEDQEESKAGNGRQGSEGRRQGMGLGVAEESAEAGCRCRQDEEGRQTLL